MLYMVTFTINIPPMLAYIPYMDPMGNALQWDTGWWFVATPLKNHGLRQMGFLHVPNCFWTNNPVMFQTTNQDRI